MFNFVNVCNLLYFQDIQKGKKSDSGRRKKTSENVFISLKNNKKLSILPHLYSNYENCLEIAHCL